MNSKINNKPLFKVKCINGHVGCLTLGKEYEVVEVEVGFYKIENDIGELQSYFQERFEIVDQSSKDKQEFSVGDKVVINKISDCFISFRDKNVKVGDVATVTTVANKGKDNTHLENPNWVHGWWFSKSDLSLAEKLSDYNLLSHQEVAQAILDGKELEMQYKTGKWVNVIPTNTTLHQLTTLNFRLKQSLGGKRKSVIKKLLESKVAVLCKCWDCDDDGTNAIEAITCIDDDYTYPYMNNCLAYKNAYAIDDNGNEITYEQLFK